MDEYIEKEAADKMVRLNLVLKALDHTANDMSGYLMEELVENMNAIPAVDAVEVDRERLLSILRSYFNIGDSYTFELTRVKTAFAIGTMTFDDFVEWDEDNIDDLCDYIMKHCAARMDGRREEEHNGE